MSESGVCVGDTSCKKISIVCIIGEEFGVVFSQSGDRLESANEESVSISTLLDLLLQGFSCGAQLVDKGVVLLICAVGIHLSICSNALEVLSDVVEGRVGHGIWFGMVVSPKVASCVYEVLGEWREGDAF